MDASMTNWVHSFSVRILQQIEIQERRGISGTPETVFEEAAEGPQVCSGDSK